MRARNAERYLSVINLTQTAIEISLEDLEAAQCRTLQAHETAAISYLQRRSQLGLSMSRLGNSEKLSDSKCKIRLKKRITGRQKWEEISCANGIWRIYRQKISQRHHRILVFTYRPLSSWMKEIPDSVLLSNLCLPGMSSPLLDILAC
jgi:1-phosphatidylinositol phosphodiesterase